MFNLFSVDGQWGSWSSWGSCSETCGKSGIRTRSRSCNNPSPQYGGETCNTLDSSESVSCTVGPTHPCPKSKMKGILKILNYLFMYLFMYYISQTNSSSL